MTQHHHTYLQNIIALCDRVSYSRHQYNNLYNNCKIYHCYSVLYYYNYYQGNPQLSKEILQLDLISGVTLPVCAPAAGRRGPSLRHWT